MKYLVNIQATITEDVDEKGNYLAPNTYLSYSKKFNIVGESLTDIAPHIDRVVDAIKGINENE